MALVPMSASLNPSQHDQNPEDMGLHLVQLLICCINYVTIGDVRNASIALERLSNLASLIGTPMQRIAAYFAESLAERILKVRSGLHKALNLTDIVFTVDDAHARKIFFDLCPFLKVAYVVTNQAIIQAMKDEKVIHIVDLNCFEAAPWINLMNLLSTRPEGPAYLKVTGIYEHQEVLKRVSLSLKRKAEKLNVAFQFNPVVGKLENVDVGRLNVKTGEALAVTSVLGLHTLLVSDQDDFPRNNLAFSELNRSNLGKSMLGQGYVGCGLLCFDSASSSSHQVSRIHSFLSALKGLSPKLMVITEQESNTNNANFSERVREALQFYAAIFDGLESRALRTSADRLKLEKMLFGKEINNLIACEGMERSVRHEKLEKWILRLELAGFRKMPLSFYGMMQARILLQNYGYVGFRIKEEGQCVKICWQNEHLFSVSSWMVRR